ncbi:MAG: chromate efflux transporter [Chloroflexota bacterium]
MVDDSRSDRLLSVITLFLKLGLTAFGGPAAHLALMHDEVVTRRKWLSEQEFLDLVGATNLIPGPNSTEMAIHIGLRRAGWPGFLAGGLGFVIPAVLMVLALAWAYVRFGSMAEAGWLMYGIKPVVIAIIAQALWGLSKSALRTVPLALVAAAVIALYFLGVNEIALLFAGGLLLMLAVNTQMLRRLRPQGVLAAFHPGAAAGAAAAVLAAVPFGLPLLFLTFLKIGAVLYGGGYVLLAFLRADLVVRYAWLTDQQLVDAIAIGQVTPGPLFTTATFIGYVLAGIPGALLATLGIFLPSFVFVAISSPLIPRIRGSAWASSFLDGVNAAALGLMAAVTWQLGRASLVDIPTILIALVSLGVLIRFKVNSTWLIVGGAALGLLLAAVQGSLSVR